MEDRYTLRNKELFATKHDLSESINSVRVEMKEQKSEMIKWMFIFWITQMISLFAFMLYFVKK